MALLLQIINFMLRVRLQVKEVCAQCFKLVLVYVNLLIEIFNFASLSDKLKLNLVVFVLTWVGIWVLITFSSYCCGSVNILITSILIIWRCRSSPQLCFKLLISCMLISSISWQNRRWHQLSLFILPVYIKSFVFSICLYSSQWTVTSCFQSSVHDII